MINNLSNTNSVCNRFIAEIRDAKIQKDRMRFRRNIERIAEILGYELSKTFKYSPKEVVTPLGEAIVQLPFDEVVLATIFRAGIPMHQGLLNYFDDANTAFVSAYRRHSSENEFAIEVEYSASPCLDGRILILCDPMLATGNSLVCSYKELLNYGTPKKTHIVTAIASTEGLQFVRKKLPGSTDFWVAAIDEEMTAQSYIVPGLGDAGDLLFGERL